MNSTSSNIHIVIDARIRQSSTGRYMDRLLEHLQVIDSENQYTILLKPGDSWQSTAKNFTVQDCPYKQFSFNLLDQITFAKFLNKLDADLVHFGMTPQEPVFYKSKRITTTHDLTMLRFVRAGKLPKAFHEMRMAGYRWLLNASLKMANHIITPTEYVKRDVSQYLPETADKITVTLEASEPPLPVEPKMPELLAKYQLPNTNYQFILYVGSAFPHKNLEALISAFEKIHAKQPELKLVLTGKKEFHYEQLEKLANESPASSNIVFTGFVSDAELKWLYENAEAYVFPSLSEGFGLPGLEAMVHGCPVVSSNATCLPEVYGDAAVYFDPNNAQEMADKINEVITNKKLRKELIGKGYKQAAKYSWRRMAEQTLTVYKQTLS